MVEKIVDNKEDLSLLARSQHNGQNLKGLLRKAAEKPEYNGKHLVVDISKGEQGIHAFEVKELAIQYRDSLPEDLRFTIYQPKQVRNYGQLPYIPR